MDFKWWGWKDALDSVGIRVHFLIETEAEEGFRELQVHVHEQGALGGRPHFIVNFPTKDPWRDASKMEFVEEGLRDLVRVVKDARIRSIAIPALGCGNVGLDWAEVEPRIKAAFEPLSGEVKVLVFAPGGAPGGD